MTLALKKFYPNTIDTAPLIFIIGRRDTGKSFLIRDLYHHHQNISLGTVISRTVISGTELGDKFYGRINPELHVHEFMEPKIIKKAIDDQLTLRQNNSSAGSLIIMDDCFYDYQTLRNEMMRLFMNHRHWNISCIVSIDYLISMPPSMRTNVDYVFILRENSLSIRRKLWENCASIFPTFDSFCSAMDQFTNDYNCLVIDNTSTSDNLEDKVFWYKAEIYPDYVLK